MRRNLFWLSDEQWSRIEPHLPTDVRGVERSDDRRVISGIVHVLRSGCRWCDCPPEYGPPTTIYNRFVRWARRGIWENLFRELAGNGRSVDTQMIDSTHVKAHRSASGGKGGSRSRLLAARAEGATRRSTHLQMEKGGSSPSWMSAGPSRSFQIAATESNRFASASASTSFVGASRAHSTD